MLDPLYILTALVAIGLVAWVIFAVLRPDDAAPATAPAPARGETAAAVVGTPAKALLEAPAAAPASADKAPEPEAKPAVTTPTATELTAVPAAAHAMVEDEPTGPNTLILVTAVGRTDPGLRRSHNEDAYVILEDHQLFVIADGMGKHAAGEVASQLCVEAITEAFQSKEPVAPPPVSPDVPADPPLPHRAARLRAAIKAANLRVLAKAQKNDAYHGMGTTVVSAYFAPKNQRVYIAHVGDSRCYRLRNDELRQLTMDHTLGAAGISGPSAALLSRAVGIEENVDVDMFIESPHVGDIYLLCSDGLSRMVSDDLIKSTLTSVPDLDEVTKILIAKANEKGGRDNITTILVRVDSPAVAQS